jgi:hypothetical protein
MRALKAARIRRRPVEGNALKPPFQEEPEVVNQTNKKIILNLRGYLAIFVKAKAGIIPY